MNTLSSDNFVWTDNTGVCDVTDLPPGLPTLKDATEPFSVKSSETGNVVEFYFLVPLVTADGSDPGVVGWRYVSTCGEFIIDILND